MTSIATPQLAPAAPSTPTAPVRLELSQTLGQMIGQFLSGTVNSLLNDTTLLLQTPSGLVDVAADARLPAGTPVTIAVQGTTQQPQIVITPIADGSRPPTAQQTGASDEASPAPMGTNTAPTNSATASLTTTASGNSSRTETAELADQPSAAAARTVTPLPPAAVSTATAIVRDAAATQGSLATLYADLEAAVAAPKVPLPAPVLDAARLLLAMRFVIPSGQSAIADDAETALMRTGLASALPTTDAPAPTSTGTNLAAALAGLRQVSKNSLDQQTDAKTASARPSPATPQTPARTNAPMPDLSRPAELVQRKPGAHAALACNGNSRARAGCASSFPSGPRGSIVVAKPGPATGTGARQYANAALPRRAERTAGARATLTRGDCLPARTSRPSSFTNRRRHRPANPAAHRLTARRSDRHGNAQQRQCAMPDSRNSDRDRIRHRHRAHDDRARWPRTRPQRSSVLLARDLLQRSRRDRPGACAHRAQRRARLGDAQGRTPGGGITAPRCRSAQGRDRARRIALPGQQSCARCAVALKGAAPGMFLDQAS